MADDAQGDTRTRRRFRLRLRLPRIRRGDIRASEEFQKLRDGLNATRHLCPKDGTAMSMVDVYPENAEGEVDTASGPFRALVCPECTYTVSVAVMSEQFRRDAQHLKHAERQFTLFGFGILVAFSAITLMTGNLLTVFGALLFSLTLFLKALFYRYRHWQATNGQMFQNRAPVAVWLREEFGRGG